MNEEKENPFALPLLQRCSQETYASSAGFPQGRLHQSSALFFLNKNEPAAYAVCFSPSHPTNLCKTLNCVVFALCKYAYLGSEFKSELCFA